MSDLLVRLKIPIPVESTVGAPALTFAHWLPLGQKEAIIVADSGRTLKLWFPIESTWWASQMKEEELPSHRNVLAHWVYADVTVADIDPNLLRHIQERNYAERISPDENPLQKQYDDLAWDVLTLAIGVLNRLLSYVRAQWGQHWLCEYEIDRGTMYGNFVKFEGKGSVDGQTWFRFGPTPLNSRTVEMPPEWRYVKKEDWDAIRSHVTTSRKPPLARALLAGAESLAANGHPRSAIAEAVTALEIALYDFAATPRLDAIVAPRLRARLGLESLKTQVEHLGLTGSVSYILPIVLPENIASNELFVGVREAIQQRQNIVHSGQRDVRDEVLKHALKSIRALIEILDRLKNDPALLVSTCRSK